MGVVTPSVAISIVGGISLSAALSIAGLSIDIVGVLLLALTDIEFLYRYTNWGQLKIIRRRLQETYINENDQEFAKICEVLKNVKPIYEGEPTKSPSEANKIRLNSRPEPNNASGVPVEWNQRYLEVQFGDGEWSATNYYRPSTVFNQIQSRIESSQRRVRLAGLALIGFGFVLQIIATGVSEPKSVDFRVRASRNFTEFCSETVRSTYVLIC